jgi:hypothetical protein
LVEKPSRVIELLEQEKENLEFYLQLRPLLNSSNREWIADFINQDGLRKLIKTAIYLHFETRDSGERLIACLSCVGDMMNRDIAIDALIEDQEAVEELVLLFDSPNEVVRLTVLKQLSVLAVLGLTSFIVAGFMKLKQVTLSKSPRLFPVIYFFAYTKDVEIRVCFSCL